MSAKDFQPSYIQTHKNGELDKRIDAAFQKLESCSVCPRNCGVNRLQEEKGTCSSGLLPEVSSFSPHFGEERPLVGSHGSGTIFLTHCNLGCSFCQNYDISHQDTGRKISYESLAKFMLELQARGCHNINFVSPTHFVPQILRALSYAIEWGLSVPLVYNTGGYDSLDTLKLLDGVFDIYMPDFKYTDTRAAEQYSQAADYPVVVQKALKEMFRQVGDLSMDEEGIALRGLLVRHLVLPDGLAGTEEAMRFLAQEISPNTYVNIMDQYYPCGDIPPGSSLNRRITHDEFNTAIETAKKAGLTRLDKREKLRLIWW
jgi:putative pyruvate formate lyase activating enzyme